MNKITWNFSQSNANQVRGMWLHVYAKIVVLLIIQQIQIDRRLYSLDQSTFVAIAVACFNRT